MDSFYGLKMDNIIESGRLHGRLKSNVIKVDGPS